MRLLVDESVTAAAIWFLRSVGRLEVVCSVDAIGAGRPDSEVAAYADSLSAIVVNSNNKDFAKLIARRPPNGRQRFRNAGRISLCCKPHREAQRLEQLMPRILSEHVRSRSESDKRLLISVHDHLHIVER